MNAGSPASAVRRQVIVALGNPDRADDGVGSAVVERVPPQPGVEVWEAIRGGLPLAQSLVGFERALVVDACPALPVGEVALIPLSVDDGGRTMDHGSWLHGLGLAQGLAALRAVGLPVPETWALAIGVEEKVPFQRGLSPQVAQAVPRAVAEVERWLAN
ncbi:MAG: hydrogenase maturation protease [Candidatus Bipolaricaulis sp.]|nr:hydrogenase maturation protease [Candidatus Bipolaricaulis sp.]